MKKNEKKEGRHFYPIALRAVSIFVPVALFICIFTLIFFFHMKRNEMQINKKQERVHLSMGKKMIENSFDMVVSDLLILSESVFLQCYFEGCLQGLEKLKKTFSSISEYKKIYDQVRFIDSSGKEIVRINYKSGYPLIVPGSGLQDKKHRYYFRDSIVLNRNEIYVSPFDLNIEHGKVENPVKPIIRFATPVFDRHGKKRGVVVLNYLGRHLLRELEKVIVPVDKYYGLLNSEGYWLKGFSSEKEWGFMFPEGEDWRFQEKYPDAWATIQKSDYGQFLTSGGLFTFSRIYPIDETHISSRGSVRPYEVSTSRFRGKDYYWVLVSFVETEALTAETRSIMYRIVLLIGAVLVMLAIGSVLVSASKYREILKRMNDFEQTNRKLNESNMKIVSLHIQIREKNRILEKKNIDLKKENEERRAAELALKELTEKLEENVEKRTKELKDAREQLVRKEKLATLGQLAGSVGHELRNPLGIINNAHYYLKMVLSGTDEKTNEYLAIIENEIGNAERIVSDLLDFSRIKSLEKKPVKINDVINDIVSRLRITEHVTIQTEISEDLPLVLGDKQKLGQVFFNLVSNAVQSMKNGGTIRIFAEKKDDMIEISVSDEGEGITEENRKKIFEPLFTTKSKGIGLGLAIARNMVEVHKGEIRVQSEIGIGSTFTICLPLSTM